jgi:hypothetical protein
MQSQIDVRCEEFCRKCGGRCCRIYTDCEKGGVYPSGQVWFEEWCEDFHDYTTEDPYSQKKYGVTPLFDPLLVHMGGNEHMCKELLEKGIDPGACQYLGKDGCIIPYDRRPIHCRQHYCKELGEHLGLGEMYPGVKP